MSRVLVRGLLIVSCLASLVIGGLALAAPPYRVRQPARVTGSVARDSVIRGGPAPDSLARLVNAQAPFRSSRTPAAVAYDPDRGLARMPETPPVPRPQLTLAGIVSEREPSAVIEGLPGVGGARVVRVGDVFGGLKVRRIGRDRVVITGLDTTWNLSVKEPWK